MSDESVLNRAVHLEKSSSKSEQFRAYHEYKNLYLKTLMQGKQSLSLKALKGLVRSGKRLHIDVSHYERELRKKVQLHRKSSHKLKYIGWKNGNLVLIFDKPLRNNQINYFKQYNSKRKRYQYIFHIHANMARKSKVFHKRGVRSIKISQYNSNMLHLNIENSTPLNLHFSKKQKEIIIRIGTKKTPHKTVKKKKKKIIVIDPGHGGKDPGAIGYRGYKEKNVVLAIAKELSNILKSRGYRVYMTRNSDYFVKLRNRTKFANRKHADIFISIHANAVKRGKSAQTYGLESYYLSKYRSNRAKRVAAVENSSDLADMNYYGKESFLNTLNSHNIIAANKLAIDLQRSTLASLKKRYKYIKDAGVREGPFWVLVGAQMPAVLVETGFITNPREGRRLAEKSYQKTLARGLANGVERYFINCSRSRY